MPGSTDEDDRGESPDGSSADGAASRRSAVGILGAFAGVLLLLTIGHLLVDTFHLMKTAFELLLLGGLATLFVALLSLLWRADIDPDLYENAVYWCFGGAGFLLAITVVSIGYAGAPWMSHEAVFSYQIALNVGGVGGLIIGYHQARTVTNVRASARAEYERDRLERLHKGTLMLLGAETEAEVAELTAEAARSMLGHQYNVVRLLEDGRLVPVTVTDEMQDELGGQRPVYRVGEETAGLAFAEGRTIMYDDVGTIDDAVDRGRARATMYLPIGRFGVLTISSPEPGAFDDVDVKLGEILTATAAVALERIENELDLAAQRDKLEDFAGFVSHDLRNPLSVASLHLSFAEEEAPSEHIDRVRDAHDRILVLIDDLLSLARAGETLDETEPVELGQVVGICWHSVSTTAASIAIDTDTVVRADRSRLRQLLENLFRNAVDHAGPSVHITVGDLDDGFFVEDDGPGIPAETRETVFDRGYSTAEEGTGLGLAIVEEIALAHGWVVRVTEGTAGGARFEFTGVEVESSRRTDGEPPAREREA